MRKTILFFLLSFPAFGSLPYRMQWDVNSSGSDSNAGGFYPLVTSPGTDESENNSGTSVTVTLTGTGTTGTSSPAFTSTTHGPGNTIVITGGSGCTTGTYLIQSQSSGTATFDRSMGSSGDHCTGTLGGRLATIGHAFAVNSGALDTVWTNQATITLTSSICNAINQSACSTGSNLIASITVAGYVSTHGDITPTCLAAATCARPLITTSTSSTEIFYLYGYSLTASFTLQTLELSNTASSSAYPIITGISGGPDLFLNLVKMDVVGTNAGGASGVYNDDEFGEIVLWGVECNVSSGNSCIADQSMSAASTDGWGMYVYYSCFHGAGTGIWDVNNGGHQRWHVIGSGFNGMSRAIYGQYTGDESVNSLLLIGNSFYNMTNENVRYNGYAVHFIYALNNVFWGGTYGMYINGYIANASSVPFGQALSQSNAYGNQSTAAYVPYSFGAVSAGVLGGTPAGQNSSDVTLTAQPFNNPTSGTACGDLSLNNASGGGALLKAAGFPGVTPLGTGYRDIGALQSKSSGGGGGAYVQ